MSSSGGQFPSGAAPRRGTTAKVKIAYISAAGVVAAALISGLFLYLSQGNSKDQKTTVSGGSAVVFNIPPAANPPAPPTFQPFRGAAFNLPSGQCAYVFSEPYVLSQDIIGSVCDGTTVYIYCTVETVQVGNSSIWDFIYYKTNWGTGGYIPDYYVYTGTNNAVEASCST
jgi:hypothetical protein